MRRNIYLNVMSSLILLFMAVIATAQAQDNSNSSYSPSAPNTNQSTTVVNQPASTTPNTNNTQVVDKSNGTQVITQTLLCPLPNRLIKSGLYWGTATGGWKSYSESFDSTISSFIGAQWVGINVGKMICIYKGNLAMSFPITLQNDTLSIAPTGNSWGTDQGGYRNCHSTNILDCPFVVKTTSVNMQQIYQSIDFFKGKPNPLQQSN